MGDIPEPKASDAISVASSNTPQAPPSRQGRRLSNLVGLDQVNYCIYLIITLKKTQSNYLTSSNDVISGQKILRKNKKKFDRNRRASSIPEEVTIIFFILSFFSVTDS